MHQDREKSLVGQIADLQSDELLTDTICNVCIVKRTMWLFLTFVTADFIIIILYIIIKYLMGNYFFFFLKEMNPRPQPIQMVTD